MSVTIGVFLSWWAVFMFFLPFDEEKLMFLCLLTFFYLCAHVFHIVTSSFLSERKSSLLALLSVSLEMREQLLTQWVSNALHVRKHGEFICLLTQQVLVALASSLAICGPLVSTLSSTNAFCVVNATFLAAARKQSTANTKILSCATKLVFKEMLSQDVFYKLAESATSTTTPKIKSNGPSKK